MPIATLYPPFLMATSLVGVVLIGMVKAAERSRAAAARFLACLSLIVGLALLARPSLPWWNDIVRWDGLARAWVLLFFASALPFAAVMTAADESSVVLALGAVLGMTILACANHLFVLFIGFEIMSLSTYLLLVGLRRNGATLEAAVKYFFSGAVAAGLYLFGFSVFYASTGSMGMAMPPGAPPVAEMGVVLMLCAALFKIGAFPMQFWLPDVYEAAEPELSGFMSTGVKAAGFLLLIRLAPLALPGHETALTAALPWIAGITMTVGNLLALRQERLQRLLAYSSISHVGYLLAGVWAWMRLGPTAEAAATIWYYLAVYLAMNTGAFLFLRLTGVRDIQGLRGYGSRQPGLTAFFVLMILSLGAIPPTGGFLAKFYVLWDVLRAGGTGLAVAIAINSVIGIAYYFRMVKAAVLDGPENSLPHPALSRPAGEGVLESSLAHEMGEGGGEGCVGFPARVTIWACSAAVLALGIFPGLRILVMGWLNG